MTRISERSSPRESLHLRGFNYRSRKIDFRAPSADDGSHERVAPDQGMSPGVLYVRVTAGARRH
jgi:hypothetical protein